MLARDREDPVRGCDLNDGVRRGTRREVDTGLFPRFSTTHISSSKRNVTLRTIQTGAARSFGMSHSIPGRIAIKQLISTTDGRCE